MSTIQINKNCEVNCSRYNNINLPQQLEFSIFGQMKTKIREAVSKVSSYHRETFASSGKRVEVRK